MNRKVFIQIPANRPSGGVKVVNQLVNLFREHNYESYIVLPRDVYQANWLENPAPTINIDKMKILCERNDIVIDNWLDENTINETRKLKAQTKVFYSQGCTYYKSQYLVGDELFKSDLGYTHFWAVSNDSSNYLINKYSRLKKLYLVSPYFEFKIAENISKNIKRENKILCFSRKGIRYIMLAKLFFNKKIKFNVVNNFTEKECYELMSSNKFFLHTAVGVKNRQLRNIYYFLRGKKENIYSVISPYGYKEGFPLPAAEAVLCGSIVIGFAMGGGLEWMSPSTCFLAKDRSCFSLIKNIQAALSASNEELDIMRGNAFRAISKFNKEHTWRQIETFLNEIN